jgi:hypothetical protein
VIAQLSPHPNNAEDVAFSAIGNYVCNGDGGYISADASGGRIYMANNQKCLGSSKVSSKLRVSIIKAVANKMGLNDGDIVLFYQDDSGDIIIKKG